MHEPGGISTGRAFGLTLIPVFLGRPVVVWSASACSDSELMIGCVVRRTLTSLITPSLCSTPQNDSMTPRGTRSGKGTGAGGGAVEAQAARRKNNSEPDSVIFIPAS